ncbi:MAG: hypothetical protein R3F29_10005 [Planctomycetota bacterium]
MTQRWIMRGFDAALLACALLAVLGSALLAGGATVPDWLLPTTLLGGTALALARRRPPAPPLDPTTAPPRRWAIVLLALLALATFALMVYGSLATPSRQWDGAVAWDLKARFLTDAPTLQQPFFDDRGVLHHSRDYPLLQPLLVALVERTCGGGRVVLAASWLLACAAVFLAALRRGAPLLRAAMLALAFGTTPTLVTSSSGGVDSGYADFLLATWMTVAGAGIAARDRLWITLGVTLMVLTKPEGLPYAWALLAAAWLTASRAVLLPTAIGLVIGAATLLPLQHRLLHPDQPTLTWTVALAALAPSVLALGSDTVVRRIGGATLRRGLGVGALLLVVLVLPWMLERTGNAKGSLARYLLLGPELFARLDRLPAFALALGEYSLLHGSFALTLPLLALAWWQRRGRRDADGSLGLWLALLLPLWLVTFLASDIELSRHLRSRLPRLLIHGCGAAWIYVLTAWPRRDLTSADAVAQRDD